MIVPGMDSKRSDAKITMVSFTEAKESQVSSIHFPMTYVLSLARDAVNKGKVLTRGHGLPKRTGRSKREAMKAFKSEFVSRGRFNGFTLTGILFFATFFAGVFVVAFSTSAWARGSKKPGAKKSLNSKTPSVDQADQASPEHVAGELLVSFKPDTSPTRRSEIFKKLGIKEKSKVGSTELYLVEVPAKSSLDSMIETLGQFAEIRFAEKNLTMRTFKPLTQPTE
jgi:hypothetical protein